MCHFREFEEKAWEDRVAEQLRENEDDGPAEEMDLPWMEQPEMEEQEIETPEFEEPEIADD